MRKKRISFHATKIIFAIELLTQTGTCGVCDGSGEWRPSVFWNVRDDHGSFVSIHEWYFRRIQHS